VPSPKLGGRQVVLREVCGGLSQSLQPSDRIYTTHPKAVDVNMSRLPIKTIGAGVLSKQSRTKEKGRSSGLENGSSYRPSDFCPQKMKFGPPG
jgi:hypothetical protein